MSVSAPSHNTLTGRLGYADAMRGFSMLLVVFGHSLLSMHAGIGDSALSAVLMTFRMPLFFFASGFFAWREPSDWTPGRMADVSLRKVCAQLVAMFCFYALFQTVRGRSVGLFLTQGFKEYWFTIALFQIFMIYLVTVIVARIVRRPLIPELLLTIAAGAIYILFRHAEMPRIGTVLAWEHVVLYLPYFVTGLLVRRWHKAAHRLIESDWWRTGVTVAYILLLLFTLIPKMRPGASLWLVREILEVAVRFAGLALVYTIFYQERHRFETGSRLSRWLRFIGRRTLDIYFLHYFFIADMSVLRPWLGHGGFNTIPLIIIGGLLTVAILAVTLLISHILRSSHALSLVLFGVKWRRPITGNTNITGNTKLS